MVSLWLPLWLPLVEEEVLLGRRARHWAGNRLPSADSSSPHVISICPMKSSVPKASLSKTFTQIAVSVRFACRMSLSYLIKSVQRANKPTTTTGCSQARHLLPALTHSIIDHGAPQSDRPQKHVQRCNEDFIPVGVNSLILNFCLKPVAVRAIDNCVGIRQSSDVCGFKVRRTNDVQDNTLTPVAGSHSATV